MNVSLSFPISLQITLPTWSPHLITCLHAASAVSWTRVWAAAAAIRKRAFAWCGRKERVNFENKVNSVSFAWIQLIEQDGVLPLSV